MRGMTTLLKTSPQSTWSSCKVKCLLVFPSKRPSKQVNSANYAFIILLTKLKLFRLNSAFNYYLSPTVEFELCCVCYQRRNLVEGETRNSPIGEPSMLHCRHHVHLRAKSKQSRQVQSSVWWEKINTLSFYTNNFIRTSRLKFGLKFSKKCYEL